MVSKLPIVKIKPPPAGQPPPATSLTQDTYTHHTSPINGPQPVAPEVVTAQKPGAKIRKLPDAPPAKYKHEK